MLQRLLLAATCVVLLVSGTAIGGSIPNSVIVFIDLSATSLTKSNVEDYTAAYIAKAKTNPQANVNYARLTPDNSGLLGAIDKPISVIDTSGDPLLAMVYLKAALDTNKEISAIFIGDTSLVTRTLLDNFLFEMSRSADAAQRLATVPIVSFLDTSDDLCVPADVTSSSIGAANHIVCAGVRDRAEVVALVDNIRSVLEWESFGLITGSGAATTTASSTATATITKTTTELLYQDVLAAQTGTTPAIPIMSVVSNLQRFAAPVNLSSPEVQTADDNTLKAILRRYVRGIVLHSVNDEEYDRLVAARARLAPTTGSGALFFLATKSSINRLSSMTGNTSSTLTSAMFTPYYTSCSALAAAAASTTFAANCDERGAMLMSGLMDSLMLFMAANSTATTATGVDVITAANMYAGSFSNPLTSPGGGTYGNYRFSTAAQAAAAIPLANAHVSIYVTDSNIAAATLVKDAQTTTAPKQRLDTAFHLRSASYNGASSSGATTSIAVWGIYRASSGTVYVSIETVSRAVIVTNTPRLIPSSALRSATVCILTPPNLADVANSVRLFSQLDYHNRAVFSKLTSSVVDSAVAITPVLLNTGADGVAVISTLLPMLSSSAASTTSCTVVVGPGRSRYNTAIAPLLTRYAIPQMEFTESDPAVLQRPASYPYMTSVTPSDLVQHKVIGDICAKFNWERVIIINVAEETARLDALQAALQEQTIGVEKVHSLTSWPLVNSTTSTMSVSMQQLKDILINIRDVAISRVVIPILPVSDTDAKLFFQLALELGMGGTQIFIFDSFMSRFLHEERWSREYFTASHTTSTNETVYNNTFQASSSTQPISAYESDDLPMILKQTSPNLRQKFPSSICIKPALGGSMSNNGLNPALSVVRELPYYMHMSSFWTMAKQQLSDVETDGLTNEEEAAAIAEINQAIHDAGFPTEISHNLRTHVGRGVFDVTPSGAPSNSSRVLVDQWIDSGVHSAFAVDAGLALIDLLALVQGAGEHPVTRTKLFEAMRARFGGGNNASLEYPVDFSTSPPKYTTSPITAANQESEIIRRNIQLILRSTVGSIGNGYRLERISGSRVDTTDMSFLVDIQLPAQASSDSVYQSMVDKVKLSAAYTASPVEREISAYGDVLTIARWKDAGVGTASTIYNRLTYILPSTTRIVWLDGTETYSGNPDVLPPSSTIRSIQFIATATLTASPGAIAFSVLGFGVTVAVFFFCYRRYQTQQLILAELYAMDDGSHPRGKYEPALKPITNDIEEGDAPSIVYEDSAKREDDSKTARRDDVIYKR